MGNLTNVYYASLGKTVSYGYDAVARLNSMTDEFGTTLFGYFLAGPFSRAASEAPTTWSNAGVSHGLWIASMLMASSSVEKPNGLPEERSYLYDAGRLNWLSLNFESFGSGEYWDYTYQGADSQVKKLASPGGATVTNRFDALERLAETRLKSASGTILNLHQYTYDAAHQRTTQTNRVGNYWSFGYDSVGQLTSAKRVFALCRRRK
jgi:YD repeat-containing protein